MIPRHFQITIGLLLLGIFISGIYIIRLTHREEAKSIAAMEDRPVSPPVTAKPQQISVLIAYDEDRALRWRETTISLPEERSLQVREVLRAVLAQYMQDPSPHPIGKGTDIKDVYLIGDNTAVINMTPQFADAHPSGILLEEMTLYSLVESLRANVPGITRVKFLVDGRERETLAGHLDLMSFYQSAAVHDLAKEFE
jgi:hypothetical protein